MEFKDTLSAITQKTEVIPENPFLKPTQGVALTPIKIKTDEVKDVKFDVHKDAIYDRLNDGTYIPKYDNYAGEIGNENRLALQQTAMEQWGAGLYKFGAKTVNYALDATIGTVYGITNAIAEGSMDGLYDNDFSNKLDDWNKRLDNSFANYYTDEQKSMSLLRSAGTVNFWANDVGGGLAFVAGALLPELAIGVATGGASMPTSFAKVGVRLGLRKAVIEGTQEIVEAGARSAIRETAQATGMNLLRAERYSKIGQYTGEALKTAGFIVRTSNFEAGMEARHNLHDATDEYLRSFKDLNGRNPSFEEYSSFLDDAVSASNKVYAANMAILSVSNVAMFGSKFGIGVNLGNHTKNAFNRLIGLGVNTTGRAIVHRGANRAQKILGNSFLILNKPIIEGVYEEGFQGVAGKTMQNYLKAKYNPEVEHTYGAMRALTDAFSEQYGTKEGWKEMTIGMIIGFGAPMLQLRAPEGLGKNSRKNREARLLTQVEQANTKGQEILRNMDRTNSMMTYRNRMESGDSVQEDVSISNTLLHKEYIASQEAFRTGSEIQEDFNAIVDNMQLTQEQISTLGGVENAESYKKFLKENFQQDAANYETARNIVSRIGLNQKLKNTPGNMNEIGEALIVNIMVGKTALTKARAIAEQIDSYIGTGGIFDHIEHYNGLTAEQKKNTDEIRKKKRRLADLRKLAVKTGGRLEGLAVEGAREFKQETLSKRYKKYSKELVLTQTAITDLEAEIAKNVEALGATFSTESLNIDGTITSTPTSVTVDTMLEEMDKLNSYMESLRKSGKSQQAEVIEELVENFKVYSDAHRQMNSDMTRMLDTDFFSTKKAAGLVSTILGQKYVMSEETRQLFRENDELIDASLRKAGIRGYESVEQYITESLTENEELSEREKYRRESLVRTLLGAQRLQDRMNDIQTGYQEAIESEQIVDTNNPLNGDTIRLSRRLNPEGKDMNNLSLINEMITAITSEIGYLQQTGTNDVKIEELQAEVEALKKKLGKQTKPEVVPQDNRLAELEKQFEADKKALEQEKAQEEKSLEKQEDNSATTEQSEKLKNEIKELERKKQKLENTTTKPRTELKVGDTYNYNFGDDVRSGTHEVVRKYVDGYGRPSVDILQPNGTVRPMKESLIVIYLNDKTNDIYNEIIDNTQLNEVNTQLAQKQAELEALEDNENNSVEQPPTSNQPDIEAKKADIETKLGIKLPAKNTFVPVSPKTWSDRKSLANQISSELKGVVERGVSMQEWLDKGYGRQLATWSDDTLIEFLEVADIERRRQEELKQPIKDKLQEIEKAVKTLNITTDKNGKLEQTSDEIITNIKSELDKIGLPYKEVVSNENGSSYKVIVNDGTQIEVVKLLKSGGALIKPTLSTAKFINHLIKTEPQILRDLISNKINAKYDAELEALEDTTTEYEKERARILAITDPNERLVEEIKLVMGSLALNVGEASANKIKEYADRIISGSQTREQVIDGLSKSFVEGIDRLLAVNQIESSSISPKTIKQLKLENKTTLPKVPTENVFSNGVQSLTKEQRGKADDFIGTEKESELPNEIISVNDIIPTQKNLTIPNLERVSKIKENSNIEEPIILIKRDGKYYVVDGHHRIANEILKGNNKIEARVYDAGYTQTEIEKEYQEKLSQLEQKYNEERSKIESSMTTPSVEIVEPTEQDWNRFEATGYATQELLNYVANVLKDRSLNEKETKVYNAHRDAIMSILEAQDAQTVSQIEDTVPQEETNAISELIAQKEQEIVRLREGNNYTIATLDEYKRLQELSVKKQKRIITPKEEMELAQLTEVVNDWALMTGTVVEGLSLADLILQKAVLENTIIADYDQVEEVTEKDVLEDVLLEETKTKSNYPYAQTYDGVTAVATKEGIEVSGIRPEEFAELAETDDFKVNAQGNAIITEQVRVEINARGKISILPTSKDLTTNYNMVLQTLPDMAGVPRTNVLRSTFNSDFNGEMSPESAYDMRVGESVTLEVNPEDAYNQVLLDDYRASRASEPVTEKEILDALSEDTIYIDLQFEIEELEAQEKKATTDKKPSITKKKLKKQESLEKRYRVIESTLNKKQSKGGGNTEAAIQAIKTGLVVRVKNKNGKLVAVLKGIRNTKGVKTNEDIRFESMREQIGDNFDYIERLANTLNTENIPLEGEVTVSNVLLGHPTFNYTVDNGVYSIENRPITEIQAKSVVDVGYVQNGKLFTKSKEMGINTTYLNRSIREASDNKVPFVVLQKGVHRIAYPVKLVQSQVEGLQEFKDIYESDAKIISKIVALNTFMAQKGVDIKQTGNSFTVFNMTDEFFKSKMDQIEGMGKNPNLSTWIDPKTTIISNLVGSATINIDIQNPIHSPKLKLDYSGLTVKGMPAQAKTDGKNTPASTIKAGSGMANFLNQCR